jgi:hypothetical protein
MGMDTLFFALSLVHPSAITQGYVDYRGLTAHLKVLWWAPKKDEVAPFDSQEK